MTLSRRQFARSASAAALFGLVPSRRAGGVQDVPPSAVADSYPRHDPRLVEEVVRVAHFDPNAVRTLVEAQPALARASWDWGFGDWETALGAAAHSGRRDIAELLLAHGARPTIFSAAMLGQLEVVQAFVRSAPGVQRTLGPHGLTLLAHARAGGTDAEPVLRYLEGLGDADRRPPSTPLLAEDRASLPGTYHFGAGERDHFVVDIRQDQLGLQRPGTNRRFLIHTGGLVFFPSGVPSVRIAFARLGAEHRLTIHDPDLQVTAIRR